MQTWLGPLTCTCELEIATAAHDLRNRIGIAQCELRLLRLQIGGRGESDQIEVAERLLAQATTLLEGLLAHACTQTSLRASIDTRTVDLVEVVRAVGSYPGRLEVDARVPHLRGNWDPDHMQHLIASLLTNAFQYNRSGRPVVITLDCAGADALISVADRGIGIPAADLPRILEPFFRGRDAERMAPGLGLGLSTAHLLVERYGGSLEADSVQGEGTTLRARLPLVSTDVTPSICRADPVRWPTPRPVRDCAGLDDPARARRERAPSLG